MTTLICLIAKNENLYINEFIDHYKKIGITNIALYDNNDIGGRELSENFYDVIENEINNGYVIYHNIRGIKKCQTDIYSNCYEQYKDKYDWILFIDCDEFLELVKHKTINDFLSEPYINLHNMIHLNWMVFGDNEKLYYENKKLSERFKNPIPFDTLYTCHPDNGVLLSKDNKIINLDYPINYTIKSIIKGHLNINKLVWENSHTPLNNILCCDQFGITCCNNVYCMPYNYSVAYLKHYCFKSTEEYANKIIRGYPDQLLDDTAKLQLINHYFSINTYSDEKLNIFKDKLNI